MKREFGFGAVGEFPGKTIFYLRQQETNERRLMLQRFLQNITRNPVMIRGATFQNFLLNAQSEVQRNAEEDVQVEVYLPNGKSLHVDIVSTNQTDDVLETVCSVLGLSPDLTYYFGLYLCEDSSGRVVIRKLQDFESPYYSLMRADPPNRIFAINDIKSGTLVVGPHVSDQLATCRAQGDKKGFLTRARELRGYGYESFGACTLSYPEARQEHHFLVQRTRSWRTYTCDGEIELEIEFHLESADSKMRWIQFRTKQCIHAAMCLQFMIEETIRLRDGLPVKRPADRVGKFKPRKQTILSHDMAFLTAESSRSSEDGGVPLSPTPSPSVAVSLSGLLSRITVPASGDGESDDEAPSGSAYGAVARES